MSTRKCQQEFSTEPFEVGEDVQQPLYRAPTQAVRELFDGQLEGFRSCWCVFFSYHPPAGLARMLQEDGVGMDECTSIRAELFSCADSSLSELDFRLGFPPKLSVRCWHRVH
jgi:hypothetical protein